MSLNRTPVPPVDIATLAAAAFSDEANALATADALSPDALMTPEDQEAQAKFEEQRRSADQAEGHETDILDAIDGLFTDATVSPRHVALALLRIQEKIAEGLTFLVRDEI